MYFPLFSLNLPLAISLAFIFFFILPILFEFIENKKPYLIIYLTIYFCILILGVFTSVTLTSSRIYFDLLITKNWASNKLTIANFSPPLVIINLFLLFPLGYTYTRLSKSKSAFYKLIFLGFLVSLFIEFCQFLLPIVRYPEVLDVLNNTISVILGCLYCLLITKIRNRGVRHDWLSKQETVSEREKRIH